MLKGYVFLSEIPNGNKCSQNPFCTKYKDAEKIIDIASNQSLTGLLKAHTSRNTKEVGF